MPTTVLAQKKSGSTLIPQAPRLAARSQAHGTRLRRFVSLLTNQRLIAGATADTDADRPPTAAESGLIKTIAAENAITAVQEAVRLSGNHGLSRANPLERHLRDVLCARVHTPQPDAALTAAGRAALGQ